MSETESEDLRGGLRELFKSFKSIQLEYSQVDTWFLADTRASQGGCALKVSPRTSDHIGDLHYGGWQRGSGGRGGSW